LGCILDALILPITGAMTKNESQIRALHHVMTCLIMTESRFKCSQITDYFANISLYFSFFSKNESLLQNYVLTLTHSKFAVSVP